MSPASSLHPNRHIVARLAAAMACALTLALPAHAQSSAAAKPDLEPNQTVFFTPSFVVSAEFGHDAAPSLVPAAAGMQVQYAVMDRQTPKVLATFSSPVAMSVKSARVAHLLPPLLAAQLPPAIRNELLGVYLEIELQGDRTFRIVQSCKDDPQRGLRTCYKAVGSIAGRPAVDLMAMAAAKGSSSSAATSARAPQDFRAADAMSAAVRSQMQQNQTHQNTMMTIIGNMNSCRPGQYCP